MAVLYVCTCTCLDTNAILLFPTSLFFFLVSWWINHLLIFLRSKLPPFSPNIPCLTYRSYMDKLFVNMDIHTSTNLISSWGFWYQTYTWITLWPREREKRISAFLNYSLLFTVATLEMEEICSGRSNVHPCCSGSDRSNCILYARAGSFVHYIFHSCIIYMVFFLFFFNKCYFYLEIMVSV